MGEEGVGRFYWIYGGATIFLYQLGTSNYKYKQRTQEAGFLF